MNEEMERAMAILALAEKMQSEVTDQIGELDVMGREIGEKITVLKKDSRRMLVLCVVFGSLAALNFSFYQGAYC